MPALIVERSCLDGEIRVPPSKSYTHRALIASTLSEGESVISNPLISDDTLATLEACEIFGASIDKLEKGFAVRGVPYPKAPETVIDCRASASTMRFLLPIAALVKGVSVFTGDRSLRMRPMGVALDALAQLGSKAYSAKGEGYPPVLVLGEGCLSGGTISIRGDLSSQFISHRRWRGGISVSR